MEFGLSKEHLLAQQLYRSFAEKAVKPLAQELDEEERVNFYINLKKISDSLDEISNKLS